MQLNLEDKTSWEKELKVESVIEGLSELEKSEDGKVVAVRLKLKYIGVGFHTRSCLGRFKKMNAA